MKKVLILVLFFVPMLFQNCTEELHEIDAMVSPEFEDYIVNSNEIQESSSALLSNLSH